MVYYRRRSKIARPYRKTYRKTYKKMSRKQKYKRFQKATVLRNKVTGGVYPERYFVKLKYHSLQRLDPTVAAPESRQLYRGNDPFDPDENLGGVTAWGYNTLANQYLKCRVYASSIKVRWVTQNTDVANSVQYAIYPSKYSTDVITNTAAAQPYSRDGVLQVATGGAAQRVTKNFMSTKKMLGVRSISFANEFAQDNNNLLDSAYLWHWILDYKTVGGTANLPSMYADIDITYYCEFFQRSLQT